MNNQNQNTRPHNHLKDANNILYGICALSEHQMHFHLRKKSLLVRDAEFSTDFYNVFDIVALIDEI